MVCDRVVVRGVVKKTNDSSRWKKQLFVGRVMTFTSCFIIIVHRFPPRDFLQRPTVDENRQSNANAIAQQPRVTLTASGSFDGAPLATRAALDS